MRIGSSHGGTEAQGSVGFSVEERSSKDGCRSTTTEVLPSRARGSSLATNASLQVDIEDVVGNIGGEAGAPPEVEEAAGEQTQAKRQSSRRSSWLWW